MDPIPYLTNLEFLYRGIEGRETRLPHIIRAQQFDRQMLSELFELARFLRAHFHARTHTHLLHDVLMLTLFWEASTRTRLSFESAGKRCGGRVISTENAAEFSSTIKGETLEDTIRVVSGYADLVVMRHKETGASDRAAALDTIPIINAGDGIGQHPTQSLIDLFAITEECGTIDDLHIAIVGDLAFGRTARSLAYLLAKFKVATLYLVSHEAVRMGDDVMRYLKRHDVPVEETDSLASVAGVADIVYMTRLQRERFGEHAHEFECARGQCVITEEIAGLLQEHAKILHPLPRNEEIPVWVDATPHAAYFEQARNGLFVRMALLLTMLQAHRSFR